MKIDLKFVEGLGPSKAQAWDDNNSNIYGGGSNARKGRVALEALRVVKGGRARASGGGLNTR